MWIKSYLAAVSGRSIGKESDEYVFLNPESGMAIVKDAGSEPYFISATLLANYRLVPLDEDYLKREILMIANAEPASSEVRSKAVRKKK